MMFFTVQSPTSSSSSSSSSNRWTPLVDELRWVVQIRRNLDEELYDDEVNGVPVSIFNVPKALLQTKPEAYLPQLIALGPYHQWQPDLYEMEKYKISSARRVQRCLPAATKFQDLVNSISTHEHLIRAQYHRFLDCTGETLAWMMAVDACFLLEFLQIYAVDESSSRVLRRVTSRMSHLVDLAGRKFGHNIILRDIMMLENQIPLFVLRKILDSQIGAEAGDERLKKMLSSFMEELSPFEMVDHFPAVGLSKHSHLLELLYTILVPMGGKQEYVRNKGEVGNVEIEELYGREARERGGGGGGLRGDSNSVRRLCGVAWGMGSRLKGVPAVQLVKKAATSRPVRFIVKVPWKILATLPGVSAIARPVGNVLLILVGQGGAVAADGDRRSNENGEAKPPRVEEIAIPSVEELVSSGVRFVPSNGDLTTISFDAKRAAFHLPVVTLDVNTEVVLRNLVAYEASAATGPLVLSRYTELMNGIIDADEDVRLLRRSGVVLNHMKSDAEVAEMWNGMNRSVRLTKVGFVDAAIEGVNRYHGSRWKVRANRFMRRYVMGSWPFLTFVAAVLLLLLTTLQAFCSVYSCSRWFHANHTAASTVQNDQLRINHRT